MQIINIHAAKTHLSALVERAAGGEPFIIAKAGRPLVTVVPYVTSDPPSRVGFLKGRIAIPDDFDRMGSNKISDMFEGQA